MTCRALELLLKCFLKSSRGRRLTSTMLLFGGENYARESKVHADIHCASHSRS